MIIDIIITIIFNIMIISIIIIMNISCTTTYYHFYQALGPAADGLLGGGRADLGRK